MTFDEALRALEKKWRDTANMLRSGAAASKRGDEGDRRRREGLRMDLCADELAALLTTRQEVAPVGDWNDWFETWAKARGMTMQLTDDGRFLCPDTSLAQKAHEAGCMTSHIYYMELCRQEELAKESTGQTSDARDGAVAELLAASKWVGNARDFGTNEDEEAAWDRLESAISAMEAGK